MFVNLNAPKKAKVYVVIGGAWGDEGKGKVATFYGQKADLVIRATGGANAGHTIYVNGQKHALHLIPGGIINPKAQGLIGQGVALDFKEFEDEFDGLLSKKVANIENRLKISGTASLLMPYHKKLDVLMERLKSEAIADVEGVDASSRVSGKIGTTGRGIGPTYTDKMSRTGLKVYDLFLSDEELAIKIARAVKAHNVLFKEFGMDDAIVDPMALAKEWKRFIDRFGYMVVNGHEFVKQFLNNPDTVIVVEGAQAVRLSIEVGDYPYVTSSDSNLLGTLSGAHLSHKDVTEVIDIFKAHFSRVGNGPFPTEYKSHIDVEGKLIPYEDKESFIGDRQRDFCGEYGATTGRPRRTGAFDAVLARLSVEVSGADCLCINHLDTLGEWGEKEGFIELCVEYVYKGKSYSYFPDDIIQTGEIPQPRYIKLEGGWHITDDMKTYESLPEKAKLYISLIERFVGVPVKYIGTGPKNEDLIVRQDVV